MTDSTMNKVRLDKWLWAARLFKTRAIAKQAIEGGKVQSEGQKLKPSKEIGVGIILSVRQGWDERTLEVLALSEQRRGAPEAQQLYRELPESIAAREKMAEQRKLQSHFQLAGGRPDKRERRQRQRMKSGDLE